METEINTAYISLGSNLGDRAGNLLLAVRGLLEASFGVNRLSAIYETDPIGIDSDLPFLNMVAEVTISNISPRQMMARMIRIEYLLGRRHKFMKAPRTVDLDLLFFNDLREHSEFLTIPHPLLHLRKFVLVPLNELTPHLLHPALNLSIQEILADVEDTSNVTRWNPNQRQAQAVSLIS